MITDRYKKIIFKIIGFLTIMIFIFSCRGMTLTKFTDSSTSNDHPSCCTNFGDLGSIDTAHHNLMWNVIPQKNMADLFHINILEFIFVGIGIATATSGLKKYKSYILAIRNRYGSFLILNYFSSLFSTGTLNTKIF